MTVTHEPQIIEFGPKRTIGMRYAGKNENNEIPQMWEKELMARAREIKPPAGPYGAYGICRCLPGVSDGSFEYFASFEASEDAPVPQGMHEVKLPRSLYAAFKVNSLAEIHSAWQALQNWLGSSQEWQGYCTGPDDCDCAHYPSFEYYPPDWGFDKPFYIYVAVKRK